MKTTTHHYLSLSLSRMFSCTADKCTFESTMLPQKEPFTSLLHTALKSTEWIELQLQLISQPPTQPRQLNSLGETTKIYPKSKHGVNHLWFYCWIKSLDQIQSYTLTKPHLTKLPIVWGCWRESQHPLMLGQGQRCCPNNGVVTWPLVAKHLPAISHAGLRCQSSNRDPPSSPKVGQSPAREVLPADWTVKPYENKLAPAGQKAILTLSSAKRRGAAQPVKARVKKGETGGLASPTQGPRPANPRWPALPGTKSGSYHGHGPPDQNDTSSTQWNNFTSQSFTKYANNFLQFRCLLSKAAVFSKRIASLSCFALWPSYKKDTCQT